MKPYWPQGWKQWTRRHSGTNESHSLKPSLSASQRWFKPVRPWAKCFRWENRTRWTCTRTSWTWTLRDWPSSKKSKGPRRSKSNLSGLAPRTTSSTTTSSWIESRLETVLLSLSLEPWTGSSSRATKTWFKRNRRRQAFCSRKSCLTFKRRMTRSRSWLWISKTPSASSETSRRKSSEGFRSRFKTQASRRWQNSMSSTSCSIRNAVCVGKTNSVRNTLCREN